MKRLIELASPLGANVFHVTHLSGREEIGRLSEYSAELLSERADITAAQLLGKNVTFAIETAAVGGRRYINGYVTRLRTGGEVATPAYRRGKGYRYTIVVHPWPWFMTRAATCRIHQKQDLVTLLKEVFGRHAQSEHEFLTQGRYPVSDYRVQYRETDFNFLCRLAEQEGVRFHFEHENGRHTLVLTDANTQHTDCPGAARIAFRPSSDGVIADEAIERFDVASEICSGTYALGDFDFHKPNVRLEVLKSSPAGHDGDDFELFDYPGEYADLAEGERYAQVRVEQEACRHERISGSCNVRTLQAGRVFTLFEHPVKALNREYLVVASSFHASNPAMQSDGEGADYHCEFVAVPKNVPYRTPSATPKPLVSGPQTAMVVGPAGEEIHTNEHGEVKLQFHWDRYGKADEHSSCWVRVSQAWAGKNWGWLMLPRIGQEVIVEFLEGDPDRPIVTGRVYNASSMPPYELPANKTRSGVKSHSSMGGGTANFNEFRFEDKKGKEQVFLHAEKDLEFRTKNDRVEWVGNEAHLIVKKDVFEQHDADYHLTIKGDHNEKADGSLSFKVGMDVHAKAGANAAVDAGQEIHLKAGMNVVVEAGTALTLKVGGSFINIGPAGIYIRGPMVMINSGGSAGSGSGATPIAPTAPREADNSVGGAKDEAAARPAPPEPNEFGPQATMFREAAASGTPFVEVCDCG